MERIHALWDEMADFDAASPDKSFHHLLTSMSELINAQNAVWIDAVHLPDLAPGDPIHGWRPRMRGALNPFKEYEECAREQIRLLEQGTVDLTTVRNVAGAGTFRVNRLVDLVGEEWFESDYYKAFYAGVGYGDAIWAGCPVNEGVEVYVGFYRSLELPRFETSDCETVAFALRGMKWFFRQYLLSHGLLAARSPLTPVERNVLQGLLGGQSEKQVAAKLHQSHHTTHDHVKRIYRKFGVANRAALMALWLGRPA